MTSKEQMGKQIKSIRKLILSDRGSFPGACEYSKQLAQELGGWVYILETPSQYGIDHKIAVSRIENTSEGLVIDVTRDNDPYVGKVSDVFNYKKTAQEIGSIYGLSGWRMMINYNC